MPSSSCPYTWQAAWGSGPLGGNIAALPRELLAKLCAGMAELFHLVDLPLTSLGGASGLAYPIYQVHCNRPSWIPVPPDEPLSALPLG